MTAWAGLGYYARARNLLACARAVVRDFDGRFPETEEELRALPGIGAYTAAAIAAIAFGERAIVIDGNIERVITRLSAIDTPLPKANRRSARCLMAWFRRIVRAISRKALWISARPSARRNHPPASSARFRRVAMRERAVMPRLSR